MRNKFFVQINAHTLSHILVSGCIRPVCLIKNRESDIQNIYPDFVLLSSKKWSEETNCSLEVILTKSEVESLRNINEDYYLFDSIIPFSRVLDIFFTDKEKSADVIWNIESGSGFVPDRLIHIQDKNKEEISSCEISIDGTVNDAKKLNIIYNRFNRTMGGFAFFRTALYDLKDLNINFPVNYFVSLGIYNESIKQLCDDLQLKLPNVFNEILNNENVISHFIGKEISTEIVQEVAKKEQISIDLKFGNIQIDSLAVDTLSFTLAVLQTYGKSKSKSVEDLLAVLFEKLEPIKREEIALIFGLNTGYEELLNYYKLKDRNYNVKFDFESKLDYYIVETLYERSNQRKSSNFKFLDDNHNFAKDADIIGSDYLSYKILDSKIITKRKDYLESLETILEVVSNSITSWFPKNVFSINKDKIQSTLMSKVKAIYLKEIQVIKNDLKAMEVKNFPDSPISQKIEEPIEKYNLNSKSHTSHEVAIVEDSNDSNRRKQLLSLTVTELRKIGNNLGVSNFEKGIKKDAIIEKILLAESSLGKLL